MDKTWNRVLLSLLVGLLVLGGVAWWISAQPAVVYLFANGEIMSEEARATDTAESIDAEEVASPEDAYEEDDFFATDDFEEDDFFADPVYEDDELFADDSLGVATAKVPRKGIPWDSIQTRIIVFILLCGICAATLTWCFTAKQLSLHWIAFWLALCGALVLVIAKPYRTVSSWDEEIHMNLTKLLVTLGNGNLPQFVQQFSTWFFGYLPSALGAWVSTWFLPGGGRTYVQGSAVLVCMQA